MLFKSLNCILAHQKEAFHPMPPYHRTNTQSRIILRIVM